MMRIFFPLLGALLLYAGFDALGAMMLLAVALFWMSFFATAVHMAWLDWRDDRHP